MRTLTLRALTPALTLALVAPVLAQAPDLNTLTPEQWRADLQQLATTLPAKHPNPFAHASKDVWSAAVQSLNTDIPNLTPHQIAFTFLRLTASLGDSHTFVRLNDLNPPLQAFPIQLFWFDEGLTVVAAAKGYENLLGARLTHINRSPVDNVVRAVKPLIAHENEAFFKSSVANTLPTAQALQTAGVIDAPDLVSFAFHSESDGDFEQSLAPMTPGESPDWSVWTSDAPPTLARKRPNAWYWSELHAPSNALYIQYNRCQNADDLPFDQFAAQALTFIDEHKPAAVIIDLRNNGGGNSSIAAPLIEGLAQRAAINHADRLFVLISRRTFSSALLNALDLQMKTNATLVGEPTGGKPNHFGEVRSFTLTHSGLRVFHSTRYFQVVSDDPDSLNPDVAIPVRAADYISGKDAAFDAAIDRIPH